MFPSEKIRQKVLELPTTPGVYHFMDKKGDVIYIGKAKNLKKRVASYFTKTQESAKTRILVKKINDLKHIIVDTETDALLLENSLIKKYQPRYNILLKDDKTYPWIYIKNENFPRVGYTRNYVKDGSLYFGPYSSVFLVKTLLSMIKKIFSLRTCNYKLTEENILKNKFKECLDYHIKTCKAPCISLQKEVDYLDDIQKIKHILRGNLSIVKKSLEEQMFFEAEKLNFEKAQELKNKIAIIENYQSKSTVVSNTIDNVDVFSFVESEQYLYVNYFKIVHGAILQSYTTEIKNNIEENILDLFPQVILFIRDKFHSNSQEIILPIDIKISIPNIKITVPLRGDKKEILDLSYKNLKYYQRDKIKRRENLIAEKYNSSKLKQMQKDLHLKELPFHIEGFDNSNIQGTSPVASCVVFKNGRASKRDYRHFKIKTVVGPDDYASMEEIIYRRYKRLLEEKEKLPQLIVIDGGKGQLNAAVNSLRKLDLYGKIAIIGIAKRLEEIYFPEDSIPLYLDKNSSTLRLIQQIRDESHRFGLLFHRQLRSKYQVNSDLSNIKGIGSNTIQKLIKHFGSVKQIKKAKQKELEEIIGKDRAMKVFDYWRKE